MKILLKTHQKFKKNVKKPVISKKLEQKGKLMLNLNSSPPKYPISR